MSSRNSIASRWSPSRHAASADTSSDRPYVQPPVGPMGIPLRKRAAAASASDGSSSLVTSASR